MRAIILFILVLCITGVRSGARSQKVTVIKQHRVGRAVTEEDLQNLIRYKQLRGANLAEEAVLIRRRAQMAAQRTKYRSLRAWQQS